MNLLLRGLSTSLMLWLAGLSLFATGAAFAQDDGHISGTLRNTEGRVLANITVYLKQHTDPGRLMTRDYKQTKTDGYGGYSFTEVEFGSYIMAFIDENYLFETYERDQFTDSSTVYSGYWYGSNYGVGSPQPIFLENASPVVIEDQTLQRSSNKDGTPYTDNRLPSAIVTNCSSFGTADDTGSFAAALANGKTIYFECSGTLVVPELIISRDTTIVGAADLTLNGNDNNRIFRVQPGIQLDISQLQLRDADSSSRPGAALYTLGYTTLNDILITSNSNASSAAGIYNHGQLQLTNTRIIGNVSNYVSALDNRGLVIGNDVHFAHHNSSYSTSVISNSGRLEISNCSISESSSNNVYAIDNANNSQMTFSNCIFFDNGTSLFRNQGTLNIDSSEFADNSGDQPLIDNDGSLVLSNTSINNNEVSSSMVFNTGRAEIANTTISTNRTSGSGNPHGGALTNEGLMFVAFTTIVNNLSMGERGDQITNSGELRLSNSIVAGDRTQCSTDYFLGLGDNAAPIISDGYNLFTHGDCGSASFTDQRFGNAALAELADNGGNGATHALLPDSDAIDGGNCNEAINTDQRGTSRPQGNQCDIGAFEVVRTSASGTCSASAIDPDGDGWGWENNRSCRMPTTSEPEPAQLYCTDASSDPDNDGWGWENNQSCRVRTDQTPTGNCNYADADLYNGWGWNNVTKTSCPPLATNTDPTPTTDHCDYSNSVNGWGWDEVRRVSCPPR